MTDVYSPIFYYPIVGLYFFVILVLPVLVARLIIFGITSYSKWEPTRKRKWLWAVLLGGLWITYPWFSIAEDIEGRVVDVTGQPVEGVLVTALWEYYPIIPTFASAPVYDRSVAGVREAVTDNEGRFRVPGFTYFPPFNQKLWLYEPEVKFYHEGLRVDYRLSKFLGNNPGFDWGIIRGSSWNGLDVVMVEAGKGSLHNGYSAQDVAVAETESTIESKTLQVLRISDRWIWLDAAAYGWKRFKIPDGFSFIIDSEAVSLDDIIVGQSLNVYITKTETGWILLSEPGGVEAIEDSNEVAGELEVAEKLPITITMKVVATSTVPSSFIISTGTIRAPTSEVDGTKVVEDTEIEKCILLPQESMKCHKRRDR